MNTLANQQLEAKTDNSPGPDYRVPNLQSTSSAINRSEVLWSWCGAALASAIIMIGAFFLSTVYATMSENAPPLTFWIGILSILAVGGMLAGLIQGFVLRRCFSLSIGTWALMSGLAIGSGTGLASWIEWQIKSEPYRELFFSSIPFNALRVSLPLIVLALVLGIAQWLVLRPHVRHAWIWVLSTTINGALLALLIEMIPFEHIFLLLAALVSSYVIFSTGALVSLLSHQRRDLSMYRTYAVALLCAIVR